MTEKVVWGIHAGRFNEADRIFLEEKKIALGWAAMGDLHLLQANRESFKQKAKEAYPTAKPGTWPNLAGQLFRYLYEMKIGDIILYPSRLDKKINIGEVVGEYEYHESTLDGYPHQRSVKWLKSIDRLKFSQSALYETGSAMGFFQVKNSADEFLSFLGHTKVEPVEPSTEGGPTADEMEQMTRDFILKTLSTDLKGFPFEDFVAQLLEKMGYRTRLSKHGGDEGIDIIAHHDELGFEPPVIKVQVKSKNSPVTQEEVSSLYGMLAGANEVGLFVTLNSFVEKAKSYAKTKEKIRLIDGDDLVKLIFEHYDQLDVKYRNLIPLRRVFIPDLDDEK